jgi:hypothetical protein
MGAPASLDRSGTRLVRAADVVWRAGAFGVVLGVPGREPLTLEGTGRALWDALADPVTPAELAAELANGFAADPDVVAADIAPVLDELARAGAIEVLR